MLTLTAVDPAVVPSISDTRVGIVTGEFVDELFPNCPCRLSPQQRTVPFAINAHEIALPVVTLTAVVLGLRPSITGTTAGATRSPVGATPFSPRSE